MKLIALNRPEFLGLVAGGLAEMGNYQWLDFGHGTQIVMPALLKIMAQREAVFGEHSVQPG